MADYEFKYAPLTGRLTGNQMIEQTEQAINSLAKLVDEAAGQVTIISTLANEANENAANALEAAEEALSTTGRTYITVSTQTDADNYYDSELIYIADSTSTNIPVADTGMLEAKTNDTKTACEQVFIADSSGEAYYRYGAITAETVGDVTTYTVSWGAWSSEPASRDYVQSELTNYLPLSGGTLTGNVNGVTPTAGDDSTKIATTEFVNTKAGNYLPLSGGTMTGTLVSTQAITVRQNADNASSQLYGGTDNTSSRLILFGKANAAYPGTFSLEARNGSNATVLFGTPSGGLTWGGNNVLTASNYNSYALPLSGGTMTGTTSYSLNNAIARSDDIGELTIFGGTVSGANPCISLRTRGHSTEPGTLYIRVRDNSVGKVMLLKPDGTLTWDGQPLLPVGIVQAFAGTTIPTGWLLCDGSAVSRTTYANLFACIGTTYGTGDGSTTFNLPNLIDKFIQGNSVAGTEHSAGLPNITATFRTRTTDYNQSEFVYCDSGALYNNGRASISNNPLRQVDGNFSNHAYRFDASRSSTIYGNSTTVQPPALTMKYIIKY